jgi:hypothetical protein
LTENRDVLSGIAIPFRGKCKLRTASPLLRYVFPKRVESVQIKVENILFFTDKFVLFTANFFTLSMGVFLKKIVNGFSSR